MPIPVPITALKDLIAGDFPQALEKIAARKVAAGLSDVMPGIHSFFSNTLPSGENPEAAAQRLRELSNARQQLGVLGVPQESLDRVTAGLRSGAMSPTGASWRLRSSVPWFKAPFRAPGAAATALQEGDVGGALNQADVGGLKNLASPLGAALSVTGAGVGGAAGRHVEHNLLREQLLAGTKGLMEESKDKKKVMKDLMMGTLSEGGSLPSGPQLTLEQLRKNPQQGSLARTGRDLRKAVAQPTFRGMGQGLKDTAKNIYQGEGGGFRGSLLGRLLAGAPEVPAGKGRTFPAVINKQKGFVPVPAEPITAENMHRALSQYLDKRPAVSRIFSGRNMGAAAGSLLPLMAMEWLMPGGYRSGAKPIRQLVQSSRPAETKK